MSWRAHRNMMSWRAHHNTGMELNYLTKNLRSSAVLTGSYVAGTVLGPQGVGTAADPVENNQLVLYVSFTIGSLTSAELKVEFSNDGTTYYQETESTVSSGTSTDKVLEHTLTATGNYRIAMPLADRYVKVSVKGTGTVTSSLMAVDAIIAKR